MQIKDQFKAEYDTVQSKQVSLYKDDMPVSHSEKMVVVGWVGASLKV